MHSTSIFPSIITLISNFMIFLIFHISIFKFFFLNVQILHLYMIFIFLRLIIFIACSHKDSNSFYMQSLPLYTSCLFSLLLNKDTVDIEKSDRICSPTFVVNEFSGLFLCPLIFAFSIKDQHE